MALAVLTGGPRWESVSLIVGSERGLGWAWLLGGKSGKSGRALGLSLDLIILPWLGTHVPCRATSSHTKKTSV